LSGGSTAPSLIESLFARPLAWESVTVWQVDERVAPDGHADRNANQLEHLPCRVLTMPVTAADLRAAAGRYARSLPERFDVIHLGVGDDGHTASWPPGDVATPSSERLVELVPEFNGRPRMTLTEVVVNAARSRIVLATGAGKRPVVERWLLGDASLPITRVRRAATVVFLDPAAAPDV
jgi:6-phosphogluconolactonase/glucosamine-6-phosphate isomerase/deaminase